MGIPIVSKWLTNLKIGKAQRHIHKLEVHTKKVEHMIENADKARKNCCPDSISFQGRIKDLRDRLSDSCKVKSAGDSESDEAAEAASEMAAEVEADHEACRREAGIVRKPKETSKPKWVDCMKKKGYPVTGWIPASDIDRIPSKR